MTVYADLATRMQSHLSLELPPVALTRVQEPPADIDALGKAVPSACSFWRQAERGVFYAAADEHMNCPVGAMVMGFDLPATKMQELFGLVEQMCSLKYLRPEEVSHIPRFSQPAVGIVYGPLSRFPLEPDVVVLWATPAQTMLLQEAAGAVIWSDNLQSAIFGRPACGALPIALNRDTTSISLGCAGMRTFTEIPNDRMLVAIPGPRLHDLDAALQETCAINEEMEVFYRTKKASV